MSLRFMLLLIGLLVAGLCAVGGAKAEAIAHPKKKTVSTKKKATGKFAANKIVKKNSSSGELQTDVKFDDSVLHGQYQTPDEALARVENEKGLNDLLGVRKHFKDRLATASEQE